MNQLEVLRESLGQCDEIILDALLMRNRIVEDIMAYKEANDIPILQPEQEAKQKEWLERRMESICKFVSCRFIRSFPALVYHEYGICRMYSKENPKDFGFPVPCLYPCE